MGFYEELKIAIKEYNKKHPEAQLTNMPTLSELMMLYDYLMLGDPKNLPIPADDLEVINSVLPDGAIS